MTRPPHTTTPDETRAGEAVSRGAAEEIARLLGHNPDRVLEVLLLPMRADVWTFETVADGRRTVLTRHVIL